MSKITQPTDAEAIEIIGYAPELRSDFERLNREWLEREYSVEPIDDAMFADPEGTIIAPGGAILFARFRGAIAGTCALARKEQSFGLCKMGVDTRSRGHGVGRKLVLAALDASRERGLDKVYLLTGLKLKAARHLYESFGFIEVPLTSEDKEEYSRAELRMEYRLKP